MPESISMKGADFTSNGVGIKHIFHCTRYSHQRLTLGVREAGEDPMALVRGSRGSINILRDGLVFSPDSGLIGHKRSTRAFR